MKVVLRSPVWLAGDLDQSGIGETRRAGIALRFWPRLHKVLELLVEWQGHGDEENGHLRSK